MFSGNLATLGIVVGVLGAAYFVPTFVAIVKKRDNLQTISLVNILLGWTIVGWVVALIWAIGPRDRDSRSRRRYGSGRKPCPSCGRSLRKETRQCRHCGYTLETRE